MKRTDLYVALFLALLAAFFFSPVLFGNATLIPFDNLYRFPPWSAVAPQFGVTQPHNELLSDLVLENYPWKNFILESLKQGELPLWNPYLFAGVPFLAAGQNSALYPFSILFYLLPLDRAYGYFAALQLWIAALAMYAFLRTLGTNRFCATVGGIVYAFSGFMLVSVVFPMVIGAAAWLPAILASVERVFQLHERRSQSEKISVWREIFWALLTSLLVGVQFLAGHVEISIYILLVTALFALWRMVGVARGTNQARGATFFRAGILVSVSVALGIALAAVQLIPLYELVQGSFRAGSQSYDTIISYAFPTRQIITFFIPDFFGNPAHHSYLDVFDFTIHSAPTGTIFWGIKNYVEAGSYVGMLPLVFALIAIISTLTLKSSNLQTSQPPSDHQTLFFAFLAIISLLFVFGTPLYALLFYGLPGISQLHTPFRWVFPYTLALSALAGIGAQRLSEMPKTRLAQGCSRGLLGIGLVVLVGLAVSWLARGTTLALAQRLVASSDLASAVFSDGRMFYSYQARNILLFALFTLGAGIAIRYLNSDFRFSLDGTPARRLPADARTPGRAAIRDVPQIFRFTISLGQVLTIIVVVLDLFVAFFDFNPRADPQLGAYVPPAVQFLQQDMSLFRITSYDERGGPENKVFNPNVGMFFDLSDIRGYDSIIPKQYADFMSLLAPQDELLNNRIASLYDYQPLSSPLLNLLNVKYVLTTHALPNPGYTLVYDGEIKIYRNDNVLPRAFLVTDARVIQNADEMKNVLLSFDPRTQVLLEQNVETQNQNSESGALPDPVFDKYSGNQVIIKTNTSQSAWLVLSDSYFPGWRAFVEEQETEIFRADGNFRAVRVPAGAHTIRIQYAPLSLRIGAVVSLLGGLVIVLGLVTVAWQRLYHGQEQGEGVRVVAKNSLVPIGAAAINQILTFAFLPILLRVLGPENNGRYLFATTTWLYLSTLTDFGLGILVTRQVARDKTLANRYLTNTLVLRIMIMFAALPLLLVFLFIYLNYLNMSSDTAWAIAMLWLGLIPGTITSAMSYLFNAFEQFEYPNAVTVATALVSTALQATVLLLGGGIIGLAAVSIVANIFTMIIVYVLLRTRLFIPRWEWDGKLVRWMFFESYPLMLNNLLASLFFRVDVFILGPLKGDTVLGLYGTAYKFINALNIIPSNFTLALFPRFARHATSAKERLLSAYLVSLKLLLWVSLPLTVATLFIAREIIGFFGGAAYLPDSAIALQWLIWFLPLSFINSLTHYVLIALNQQRFLTKAFLIGLVFNIAANLLLIPPLSYTGAALVTVLSELALLIPFYISLRRELAPVNFFSLAWRPAVAASAMGIAIYFASARVGLVIALGIGVIAYAGLLFASGAIGEEERILFRRLVKRSEM